MEIPSRSTYCVDGGCTWIESTIRSESHRPAADLVRVGPDGTPFFEAKWRDADGNQLKRRLGRAWMEKGSEGGWVKRRGRTPPGWLDERSAHVAAAEKVAAVERERAAAAEALRRAGVPTVRRVAHEWLAWKRDVKGGAPSTLRENAILLREPGTPHRRGSGESKGRIMARFGDRPIDAVTTREVSTFLRELARAGLSARNVNEHRAVLHSIFVYAMKPDTYALPVNPVAGTDKRYEPPPPPLDHYEIAELESLARACERGEHRSAAPNYHGRPNRLGDDEHERRGLRLLQPPRPPPRSLSGTPPLQARG
jgi:hypothetical protein